MSSKPPIPITRGRGGVSVPPRSLAAQIPQPKVPASDQRAGNYITKTSTFITRPGTISTLHSADTAWVRVTMNLDTAGPVAVSTAAGFSVNNGQGIALQTDVPVTLTIPKASRLYITSPTVNRISYSVEPVPWAEQIMGAIMEGFALIARAIASLKGS